MKRYAPSVSGTREVPVVTFEESPSGEWYSREEVDAEFFRLGLKFKFEERWHVRADCGEPVLVRWHGVWVPGIAAVEDSESGMPTRQVEAAFYRVFVVNSGDLFLQRCDRPDFATPEEAVAEYRAVAIAGNEAYLAKIDALIEGVSR